MKVARLVLFQAEHFKAHVWSRRCNRVATAIKMLCAVPCLSLPRVVLEGCESFDLPRPRLRVAAETEAQPRKACHLARVTVNPTGCMS